MCVHSKCSVCTLKVQFKQLHFTLHGTMQHCNGIQQYSQVPLRRTLIPSRCRAAGLAINPFGHSAIKPNFISHLQSIAVRAQRAPPANITLLFLNTIGASGRNNPARMHAATSPGRRAKGLVVNEFSASAEWRAGTGTSERAEREDERLRGGGGDGKIG